MPQTEIMTNNNSRVLVALNSLRLRRRALEIGAHLAVQKHLPLTTLFIENVELRYASQLPFVQEIDRLSGALTTFEPPRLERLHRLQIRQVRQWLADLQSQLPSPGDFQIVQGNYTESVMEIAGEGDFLVFSTVHEWAVIHQRPPLWVWFDDSPGADRTLALAMEFASRENYPLLVAGSHPAKSTTSTENRFILTEPDGFIDLLNKQGCSAVFCPRSSPLAKQLPMLAPCPVLLV